jgi:glycine/D-amino acid oxidase-like deaminating enzyme
LRHEHDPSVVVVGCGGLGSAACYWLAKEAGSAVLGLEQFPLDDHRDASQNHSGIIRLAQHQGLRPIEGLRRDHRALTDPTFARSIHV